MFSTHLFNRSIVAWPGLLSSRTEVDHACTLVRASTVDTNHVQAKEIGVLCDRVVSNVYVVHAILASDGGPGRLRLSAKILVFPTLAPGASDEHVLVVHEDALDASNRFIVRYDWLRRRATGTEVKHAGSLVCVVMLACSIVLDRASTEDLLSTLRPTAREYGAFVLEHGLSLALSTYIDLVEA
jgi:hypothetical protein